VITVLLCSVGFLAKNYLSLSENKLIFFAQFVVVLIPIVHLTHLITLAKARVILTTDGVKHIWVRRFMLNWEKNFIIPWDIVDDYVFHEDRTFDSFIINMKNKRRYKLNRFNVFPIKDDFYKLVNDFPRLADEYKNATVPSESRRSSIKHGESIYAGIVFKGALIVMALILLLFVIMKVLNPDSQMTWTTIGFLGSAVLFYGLMMVQQKRKN
jgi:hypothetical protein